MTWHYLKLQCLYNADSCICARVKQCSVQSTRFRHSQPPQRRRNHVRSRRRLYLSIQSMTMPVDSSAGRKLSAREFQTNFFKAYVHFYISGLYYSQLYFLLQSRTDSNFLFTLQEEFPCIFHSCPYLSFRVLTRCGALAHKNVCNACQLKVSYIRSIPKSHHLPFVATNLSQYP